MAWGPGITGIGGILVGTVAVFMGEAGAAIGIMMAPVGAASADAAGTTTIFEAADSIMKALGRAAAFTEVVAGMVVEVGSTAELDSTAAAIWVGVADTAKGKAFN